ncbi:MAG: cell division protein FtsL [Nitrospinota bacterium]
MRGLATLLVRRGDKGPWHYLLCVPVLIASLVALAWPRLHVLQLRYELNSLQTKRDRLLGQNRRRRLERASLRSLSRIEAIARRDLGLVDPQPGQVVWVKVRGLGRGQGGRR